MSVSRQGNWLGQQRVDVPHIRAVESSIANDFDLLAGTIMAGKAPLVVSGFYLVTAGITQGTSLRLRVADSTLVHFYASEAGSIFHVAADRPDETLSSTNSRVIGSFTPGQVNYIGIDLVRSADQSTTDLVQFIDVTSLTETPKTVPLARTLDYRIVISSTDFDSKPGVAPIAKVTLDDSGTTTVIEDARNIFWRLGSGGTLPDPHHTFSWPDGRKEALSFSETGQEPFVGDLFLGGDKAITSLKQWMDAIMTRVWEIGGGEFWYSPVADRNVVMTRSGAVLPASGEYFYWDGTTLTWTGLALTFANSSGVFNQIVDGSADLADGECVYVDIDRTRNRYVTPPLGQASYIAAAKAPLRALGMPVVPGSRWVLAWRFGSDIFVRDQSYPVGSSFKLASISAGGTVKLSATDSLGHEPAFVATVDSAHWNAYAAGLTRGSDFVGGPGPIKIGGLSPNDEGVILKTTRAHDEVQVLGQQPYAGNFTAPLAVQNTASYVADNHNLTMRLLGNDGGASLVAHEFESTGAIGWRNVAATPTTPNPTVPVPIRSKTFFRNNGVPSPNRRDQFCVMWFDGTIIVIAESPLY